MEINGVQGVVVYDKSIVRVECMQCPQVVKLEGERFEVTMLMLQHLLRCHPGAVLDSRRPLEELAQNIMLLPFVRRPDAEKENG